MIPIRLQRRLCPILVALVVLAATGCGRSAPQESIESTAAARRDAPNVLLISIDSLRSDHLSCYGYGRDTSPTIDRLATEGALFEIAVSSTSWTLPTHATMLTGLPGSVHGCNHYTRFLHPSRRTLAESFKAAGYATAGFWSGPFLHPVYGFAQGFDQYVNCSRSEAFNAFDAHLEDDAPSDTPRWTEVGQAHKTAHRDVTSPRILEAVTEWLDQPRDGPFFMFVHMWDVHFDYVPPPPFDTKFDPDYRGEVNGRNFRKAPKIRDNLKPRDIKHIKALYDGEIAWTDMHVGKIIEKLEASNTLENTIVVVTADHGEAFWEHQEFGHYLSLFEEETRVPLVVRYPGMIPAGRRIISPTGTVDIAPTILDLAGLPPLPNALGESLVDVATGAADATPPRVMISEMVTRDEAADETTVAIRTLEWKYMIFRETSKPIGLWNLRDDPGEQDNLLTKDAPLLKRAASAYQDLTAQLTALVESHPLDDSARDSQLPDDIQRQLRSLGYIGDDDEDPGEAP